MRRRAAPDHWHKAVELRREWLEVGLANGPQQDAYWIAHYDVLRRLGLAQYAPPQAARLDDWATLARAAGWWWPGEDVCVVVERPVRIDTVPLPDDAPPAAAPAVVAYRDGWRPR